MSARDRNPTGAASPSALNKRNPPLIQYWHDTDVLDEIEDLFSRARAHNPEMRQMIFDEKTATELIERHFSVRELTAFRACAVPAMQADYFRYCAVYALGGAYCDADARCSGSLMPLLDSDGALFEYAGGHGLVTNHFFWFKYPRHPLLKISVDIATRAIERRLSENVQTVTGPLIFSALTMMWRFGLDDFVERLAGWHSAVPVGRLEWVTALESARAVVGNYNRIAAAFDGVEVSSYYDVLVNVLTDYNPQLRYRKNGGHYAAWRGSIYR